MKRPYKHKSKGKTRAGKAHVGRLLELAGSTFSEDKERAHKYVGEARKIGMKLKLKLSPELQRKFCKHCYKYIVPGVNARVRVQNGKVVYTCAECGKHMRFPL